MSAWWKRSIVIKTSYNYMEFKYWVIYFIKPSTQLKVIKNCRFKLLVILIWFNILWNRNTNTPLCKRSFKYKKKMVRNRHKCYTIHKYVYKTYVINFKWFEFLPILFKFLVIALWRYSERKYFTFIPDWITSKNVQLR